MRSGFFRSTGLLADPASRPLPNLESSLPNSAGVIRRTRPDDEAIAITIARWVRDLFGEVRSDTSAPVDAVNAAPMRRLHHL